MTEPGPAGPGQTPPPRGARASPRAGVGPTDTLVPGPLGAATGWVLGTVAAAVLFAMMALTFLDVAGRKLLARPIYGAYELTEFLMGTLIFCALPLVTAREAHVTIDVFDHLVRPAAARWQRAVVSLASAGALAFIALRLWLLSASHFRTREVTMTLHIPHGPFSRLFAVLAGLAAVACLAVAWGYLSGARQARSASPGPAA